MYLSLDQADCRESAMFRRVGVYFSATQPILPVQHCAWLFLDSMRSIEAFSGFLAATGVCVHVAVAFPLKRR